MNNKIFILNGFSGSGKDTILKEITKSNPDVLPIVSHSSRPIRENEIDGVDYNFVSKEQFLNSIENDDMLEHRAYNVDFEGEKDTWYYGISKNSISDDKSHIVVLDIKGAKALKELYGDRVVLLFIYVDDETRKQRAIKRGSFDKIEWERRLADDKTLFQDTEINDYKIENIELNKTVAAIQSVIDGNKTDSQIINIQKAIKGQRLPLQNEKQLQQKLETLFDAQGLSYEREKVLDESNIIDFLFDNLGVEIKIRTKASAMSIYRQIERYCSFDEIKGILLLTSKSISMPEEINGKPIYVISLSRISL